MLYPQLRAGWADEKFRRGGDDHVVRAMPFPVKRLDAPKVFPPEALKLPVHVHAGKKGEHALLERLLFPFFQQEEDGV